MKKEAKKKVAQFALQLLSALLAALTAGGTITACNLQ